MLFVFYLLFLAATIAYRNQTWGDPRLIKKYKGIFRPRQLRSPKSSWSLPVYTAPICKVEAIQPPIDSDRKQENTNANTYTYEEEESEGEFKKSKILLTYGEISINPS